MSVPARGGLLDLLVPDARDRRAIDETLADWREERSASTGVDRLSADLRGVAACVRVSAGIVAAPYWRPAIWRYLLFSLLGAAAIGMFVNIDMLVRPTTIAGSASLWLSIVPASAAWGLAVTASAGLGLRRGQGLPLPSTAIGMCALLIALHGWVVPESNQRFREAVYLDLGVRMRYPSRGAAELTLPMVVSSLGSPDENERARALAVFARKTALLSLCMSMILLGEAIRRRLPGRWRWGLVQLVSGACAVGVAIGFLAAITPAFVWLPGPVELSVPPYSARWFVAAGLMVLLTWWLARRTPQRQRENADV